MRECDVSVVIPFYKGKSWLIEAVESVKRQSIIPKEIIIVDDGAQESVPEEICGLSNMIVIKQKNSGAAYSRNRAITLASGKYIAFLDADDIWHSQKLEIQYNAMEKENAVWSITSYAMFQDGDNGADFPELQSSAYSSKELLPGLLCTCQIATPTVMVRRDALIDNQFFFNESLSCGEDTCLWYTLANYSNPLVIKQILANIRSHGNNAASQIGKQLLARRDLWHFWGQLDVRPECRPTDAIKFTYRLCLLNGEIAKRLIGESRVKKSMYIAACFYFIPWILFKLLGKIYHAYIP